MPKLLIVEDDDFFRDAVQTYLNSKGYEVVSAPDGRVARNILSFDKIDVVLSDVQMPFVDGIELLKWSKDNRPVPFILMTGFSNILETKTAYELGAQEFLSKPFKNEELLAAIKRLLPSPTSANTNSIDDLDTEFCKVSIDEFVARPKIDFDVYVRLSKTKFIKIGNNGDNIPSTQIHTYKTKGLNYLHIRREDFGKLVEFNMELSKIIAKNDSVTSEKKLNFMKYTGEVLLEKAFVDGMDVETFNDAKEFLTTTVSVITESKDNLDLIQNLNSHSDYVYAHSLAVAMFSLMIGRRMGLNSNQSFFKLSMAGLFIDIGMKELPRDIIEKPRLMLSQTERTLLETHSSRSMEILSMIPNVPSDVIQMVYEHHEDNVGQGYPRQLTKNQLHPLSKILIVANLFAENTIKGPHHSGMSGPNSIERIERVYGDRVDPQCMVALKSIFASKGPESQVV